jgi:menaquinone-dependent protoporphyrinogen oxidase
MARILVGIDGSAAASGAARFAVNLAHRLHDSLTLVCVVPPTPPQLTVPRVLEAERLAEENFAYAEALLRKTAGTLGEEIRIDTQVLGGNPAAALEELARADDVEMVVVGSHGLNPVERAMLGSVASRLMRTCRKPVVVIPPPAWRRSDRTRCPGQGGSGVATHAREEIMKILVAYGSTFGSTAAVARRIADRLRARGAAVVVADVRALASHAYGFDAIIVGGRVWGGRYPRRVVEFVRRNLTVLRSLPSAFFSVCLWNVSRVEGHRAEARAVPLRFLQRMGWKPDRVEVIAGSLAFSRTRLGVLGKWLTRAIWKRDLGPLDPSGDYTFTDWEQVDAFADAFLRTAAPRPPPKAIAAQFPAAIV